ncbi:syntaxin-plants SYP6 [Babesia ovata]|uniref:Syntaxin-plants SYP6 n=1 Tax=Babesia ovata TaxID=189622 RepID=A0A2H6KBU7_9APIC|nr:syntaxin-plants SYP6 [Babesia ovata]GBE60465.1 syntaxin-plants SYP6 [Babesia ovata]
MASVDAPRRDPYDEAENTVRKNIRKLIVLQSQVMEELSKLPKHTRVSATTKGAELLTVCAGIESDISELQKVIDTIKRNGEKYRISAKIISSRQNTIDEFKSKLKSVRDRNEANDNAAANAASSTPSRLGNSLVEHQLQTQKQDLLEQQDVQLSVLTTSAQSLQNNALAINTEVTTQNTLLRSVDEGFTETQLRLNAFSKRMAVFLDTNNPSLLKLVIMLSAIAILLLMVIIVF